VKNHKLLQKLRSSPANTRFDDVRRLVEAFGFRLSRTSGSHHVFIHLGINEIVNLQEVRGEAKPYQVRQFLRLVDGYNLTLEGE